MSPTAFEPLGFILKDTVVYAVRCVLQTSVWAVRWAEDQTARTDARKTYRTAYTTVSLTINQEVRNMQETAEIRN